MLKLIMSRLLSDLLGANEPMFSINLTQLERASGMSSTDVRLVADILAKSYEKTRYLGLDPKDTTGSELYHAQLSLIKLHDKFLVSVIGGNDVDDVEDLLPRIKHIAERINVPKSVWVIKHSIAKRLLKDHPPKQVMKLLGYRSIDSMLKREPVGELYGAFRFIESSAWQKEHVEQYKKLIPSNFEQRPIEFFLLDSKKWSKMSDQKVRSSHHNLLHSKEVGSILILPMPIKKLSGITITLLPLILHYVNEIRIYSSYFKHQQVKNDFGSILVQTILNDPENHANMAGQNIHWRVIQRHFASYNNLIHPSVFEPHVQVEDISWRKAEDVLFRLEPALHYWYNLDYVGVIKEGKAVSFNMMDVAINYLNNLPYGRHTAHHMKRSLINELYSRYLDHGPLQSQVLSQLDNEEIQTSRLIGEVV